MRTKINRKLSNAIDKLNVEPCFIFFQGFVLTSFGKRNGGDLLNKQSTVFEKVVYKEKLIEYMRGNPVILEAFVAVKI